MNGLTNHATRVLARGIITSSAGHKSLPAGFLQALKYSEQHGGQIPTSEEEAISHVRYRGLGATPHTVADGVTDHGVGIADNTGGMASPDGHNMVHNRGIMWGNVAQNMGFGRGGNQENDDVVAAGRPSPAPSPVLPAVDRGSPPVTPGRTPPAPPPARVFKLPKPPADLAKQMDLTKKIEGNSAQGVDNEQAQLVEPFGRTADTDESTSPSAGNGSQSSAGHAQQAYLAAEEPENYGEHAYSAAEHSYQAAERENRKPGKSADTATNNPYACRQFGAQELLPGSGNGKGNALARTFGNATSHLPILQEEVYEPFTNLDVPGLSMAAPVPRKLNKLENRRSRSQGALEGSEQIQRVSSTGLQKLPESSGNTLQVLPGNGNALQVSSPRGSGSTLQVSRPPGKGEISARSSLLIPPEFQSGKFGVRETSQSSRFDTTEKTGGSGAGIMQEERGNSGSALEGEGELNLLINAIQTMMSGRRLNATVETNDKVDHDLGIRMMDLSIQDTQATGIEGSLHDKFGNDKFGSTCQTGHRPPDDTVQSKIDPANHPFYVPGSSIPQENDLHTFETYKRRSSRKRRIITRQSTSHPQDYQQEEQGDQRDPFEEEQERQREGTRNDEHKRENTNQFELDRSVTANRDWENDGLQRQDPCGNAQPKNNPEPKKSALKSRTADGQIERRPSELRKSVRFEDDSPRQHANPEEAAKDAEEGYDHEEGFENSSFQGFQKQMGRAGNLVQHVPDLSLDESSELTQEYEQQVRDVVEQGVTGMIGGDIDLPRSRGSTMGSLSSKNFTLSTAAATAIQIANAGSITVALHDFSSSTCFTNFGFERSSTRKEVKDVLAQYQHDPCRIGFIYGDMSIFSMKWEQLSDLENMWRKLIQKDGSHGDTLGGTAGSSGRSRSTSPEEEAAGLGRGVAEAAQAASVGAEGAISRRSSKSLPEDAILLEVLPTHRGDRSEGSCPHASSANNPNVESKTNAWKRYMAIVKPSVVDPQRNPQSHQYRGGPDLFQETLDSVNANTNTSMYVQNPSASSAYTQLKDMLSEKKLKFQTLENSPKILRKTMLEEFPELYQFFEAQLSSAQDFLHGKQIMAAHGVIPIVNATTIDDYIGCFVVNGAYRCVFNRATIELYINLVWLEKNIMELPWPTYVLKGFKQGENLDLQYSTVIGSDGAERRVLRPEHQVLTMLQTPNIDFTIHVGITPLASIHNGGPDLVNQVGEDDVVTIEFNKVAAITGKLNLATVDHYFSFLLDASLKKVMPPDLWRRFVSAKHINVNWNNIVNKTFLKLWKYAHKKNILPRTTFTKLINELTEDQYEIFTASPTFIATRNFLQNQMDRLRMQEDSMASSSGSNMASSGGNTGSSDYFSSSRGQYDAACFFGQTRLRMKEIRLVQDAELPTMRIRAELQDIEDNQRKKATILTRKQRRYEWIRRKALHGKNVSTT